MPKNFFSSNLFVNNIVEYIRMNSPLGNVKISELKKLIYNYNNFIFISPHLDDAILSCAQLIVELTKSKKNVTIITVFTKASTKTIAPQAKEYIAMCNYKNATKLFIDRKREDLDVAKYLNIKIEHLDFRDAAWREDQNKRPIYKNSLVQMSGVVLFKDKEHIDKIQSKLKKIIPRNEKTLILGPCGIGGHVDHVIVSKILIGFPYPKLFWEDFPYNIKYSKRLPFLISSIKFERLFSIKNNKSAEKEKLIKIYKSQFRYLFPSGKIPRVDENYYLAKNLVSIKLQ